MADTDHQTTRLARLRCLTGCALLGFVIAGCFGHNDDTAQWASGLVGAILGGAFL